MIGILIVYIFEGMYQEKIGELVLETAPAFILGGVLGLATYRSIKSNQVTYHRVIYSILLANGVYIFVTNLAKVV
ncbi:MAG: hypothetical protein HRU09_19830 [Oligoflexales bacterium]|nr:hypothetical protein [Oligoflexales bacterium]